MHREVRVSMGSSYAYNARLALVVDEGSARGRSGEVVVVVVVPDLVWRTTEVVGSPSAGAEKSLSGRVIAGPLVVRVTASSTNAGTTKRTNLGALISSGEAGGVTEGTAKVLELVADCVSEEFTKVY